MSTERSPGGRSKRGITHAYQTGEGLHGNSPGYEKERNTLWQGWDKALANRNHPGTQTFEQKRKQGQSIDDRVHQTPVSQAQVNQLKAERNKARIQSQLIPRGPGGARVHSAKDVERERRIAFQEKRLGRQSGNARDSFDASSKGQTRGPLRGPER